jgi:hypothetical protein
MHFTARERGKLSYIPATIFYPFFMKSGCHPHVPVALNETMPAVLHQVGCWFNAQRLLADMLKRLFCVTPDTF